MKHFTVYISLNWLQQYLPTIDQVDASMIAEELSNSIAEVEQIIRKGEGVNNIVVGEITAAEPHPKNDKWQVCQVKVGDNTTKQTVHGGEVKVKVGNKVPVCLPGGSVLSWKDKFGEQNAIEITEREVEGVNSQGVLCSIKELGLADEHKQVMLLDPNEQIGKQLDEYIKDNILEIENKSLTHRPDAFSHLGIARELSAILNLKVEETYDLQENITQSAEELPFKVDYKVKEEHCPRFTALTIRYTSVKPSPFWMQSRLANTGMRPINNIIDTTNYMAADIGQPAHAFDYDKLEGAKIIVRMAKEGEEMKAIDGKTYKMKNSHIMLADKKGAIGIPGIMGGERTEITNETKNVTLVVENWDMFKIRRTSRDLGLRSEASMRFEKGLDPTRLDDYLKIGVNTILDVAGGEIASKMIDIYPQPEEPVEIAFNLNNVAKILGIDISKEEIIDTLENLQIKVIGDEKIEENALNQVDQSNKIKLIIPSFRRDLKIEEDIVEEIARIHGFQNFPKTLPTRDLTPSNNNPKRLFVRNLKRLLSGYGSNEIYTYTMIGDEIINNSNLEEKEFVKVANPLSPELEYLRHSISPSLIEKVLLNAKNHFDDFSLFEISRIIDKTSKNEDKLPDQPFRLGAVHYAQEGDTEKSYAVIKGIVDQLAQDLRLDLEITSMDGKKLFNLEPIFHPVQSAIISLDGEQIGLIGNIHPVVKNNWGLDGSLSILELEIESLLDREQKIKYEDPVDFPAVYRDLSFYVSSDLQVQSLLELVEGLKLEVLENVEISDIYEAPKKKEEKSVTLSLVLRSGEGTLDQKEADAAINKITKTLESKAKANLRK
ncbi:phenylalanine--tRNA ligase subunit beta [Candidatus Dojkabacteria bacterium]|nr:phenylalanine--tRNA ligase subunit beta [Candidatus Dojkabacteria bacterium]